MDFAGSLEDKGFILLAEDRYSRYPFAKITPTNKTETIVKVLDEYIGMFGFTGRTRSDQGSPFTSEEFTTYCKTKNVDQFFSPVGDHRASGQTERLIKTIKERLGALKLKKRREIARSVDLKTVSREIKTTPNPKLEENPPFELFLGVNQTPNLGY